LADQIEDGLRAIPGVASVRSNLHVNKPQLEVAIDRNRASDLGVSVRDIATTLQILLGGLDLSKFKLGGQTYKAMAQLEQRAGNEPRDIEELSVHGNHGALISLSSVVNLRETIAPRAILHFDRRRSVTISADLNEALSQGEGIEAAGRLVHGLLPDHGYQIRFTGESGKFLEAGRPALLPDRPPVPALVP